MYAQMKKNLYHKTEVIPCNYPGKVTTTKLLLCVYYVQDVDFGEVPSCPQEDLARVIASSALSYGKK